jgi:hypothetical protein
MYENGIYKLLMSRNVSPKYSPSAKKQFIGGNNVKKLILYNVCVIINQHSTSIL